MNINYKERNCSIDVLRCLLIFGICLLHSITQSGHNVRWAANALLWCVIGFTFISGWFSIKFSIYKVLKLYGISFYCATVFVLFDIIVSKKILGVYLLQKIYNITIGQWFLNAYVIVMCFAPIVNLAKDRITLNELYPMLMCVFGWSFATTLPVIGKYFPKSQGLTAYSSITLLGTYVWARVIRKWHDNDMRFKRLCGDRKIIVSIIGISLFFASIGLSDYNSPFSLILATCVFLLLKDCYIPKSIVKICQWLVPSMFTVYLIHSHRYAWGYLKVYFDRILSFNIPLMIAYLFTAITIFIFCLLLDFPRRIICKIYKKIK